MVIRIECLPSIDDLAVTKRSSTPPTDPSLATDADVYHAYRLILGRDPDPDGLAHYRQLITDGLTVDALARTFLHSDEHTQRIGQERRNDEAVIDLGGYQVIVRRSDPDFGADIAHWRVYEEPVRDALRELLTVGDTCLDVGANIGVMTFLAAAAVGPTGRVIAVEPNPDNVQLLYRGILLNRCSNVEVLPLAAAGHQAIVGLSGRSNTRLMGPDSAAPPAWFVQSVTLDETLATLPKLDVIKMDIEGTEAAALRGLERLITTHRPALVVEFNPRCLKQQGEDPAAFVAQILELYPDIRVVSQFGDDRRFARADDLVSFWHRREAEVAAAGKLPSGLLHFDLVTERR